MAALWELCALDADGAYLATRHVEAAAPSSRKHRGDPPAVVLSWGAWWCSTIEGASTLQVSRWRPMYLNLLGTMRAVGRVETVYPIGRYDVERLAAAHPGRWGQ